MSDRQKLLTVAFYLAKFNDEAVRNLGYVNFREAFNELGAKLDYSPNSVKNRRDDFDPLFGHRAGWHQVELSKSNLEIVEAFDHLSEEALRAIVFDLLDESSSKGGFLLGDTIRDRKASTYTTRGVTGKKAEALFIKWFQDHFPLYNLIDTRDFGCGYDFGVIGSNEVYEVKGLSGIDGGVLFTDKEWKVAAELQDEYHLVLVKDCFGEDPIVEMYSNPHEKFSPKKQVSTTINVNWGINVSELKQLDKD